MSTRVLLIRHATTPKVGKGLTGWLPGISLDAPGKQQAATLVHRLRFEKITRIFSSPLERTVETAEPLAQARQLPVTTNPDFGEIDFGEWQGKDFAEIESHEYWRPFNDYRSFTRAPGGEMMLETQARMVRGLHSVVSSHPNETIAIFSHADAIKSALCHLLGIPIDFHLRLEILPVSVTTIEFFRDLPIVRAVNDLNSP